MTIFRGIDIWQAIFGFFAVVPYVYGQSDSAQFSVMPQKAKIETAQATGPLRVDPGNPRYFTDGSGKAVYLAGSHTWVNFIDYGITDPPPPFDYTAFLEFLVRHNHNFFRLWAWELPKSTSGNSKEIWFRVPFPWVRPGPGMATDGKPKFDLSRFNESYFERLRNKVITARDRGIYVAVMLFDGYGPQFNRSEKDGFPFDEANNINGVSCGGTESQSLTNSAVTTIQEAYIRKAIDTINDLDNVLYEIANEAGSYSTQWQYHIIDYIKAYEATKPAQHPVGMTFQYSGGNDETLFLSNADWISPSGADGYGYPHTDPPSADGRKVIINDTDHSFYYTGLQEAGAMGQRAWVWKNFLRGNNVAFMDPYLVEWPGRNKPNGSNVDPYWEILRLNMGYTRIYAEKMNLSAVKPYNELVSTRYCLANPGKEYLVYLPDGDQVTLDLSASSSVFLVEWMDPVQGKIIPDKDVTGGDKRIFKTPFQNDAVLYLRAKNYGQDR
ncbi:MAG: putative collagen-binding domain-containing protein [Bdellovibrionota bacterium]